MAFDPDLLKHIRGFPVAGKPAFTGVGFTNANLRGIQGMNLDAAATLAEAAHLGENWQKLTADGNELAREMTRRLNNPRNKQLYCDARKWVNAENVPGAPSQLFGVGVPRNNPLHLIRRPIEPDEGFFIYVEYNATVSREERLAKGAAAIPDQHFFNLVLELDPRPTIIGGADTAEGLNPGSREEVQLAHMTIFPKNIAPLVGPGSKAKDRYTKIGFMHLKDDLAQGVLKKDPREALNARGIQYPQISNARYGSTHRTLIPGQFALAANPPRYPYPRAFRDSFFVENFRRYFIHIQRDAARNPTKFTIGLQRQSGNVSDMAIRFNAYVLAVLQEYFDAGFDASGFNSPGDASSFYANNGCSAYNPATNIGRLTDIPQPADQKTLPLVGGKRKKTRRGKKNRKATRKNRA